jgi:hypothetical protein
MTDKQTTALRKAYTERAKIIVHLAANPNNPIVQGFGRLVLRAFNRTIARYEAKHGTL